MWAKKLKCGYLDLFVKITIGRNICHLEQYDNSQWEVNILIFQRSNEK